MSESDCAANLKGTELLERVLTISSPAVFAEEIKLHCFVRSFAWTAA